MRAAELSRQLAWESRHPSVPPLRSLCNCFGLVTERDRSSDKNPVCGIRKICLMTTNLILASQSPRRRMLLRELGLTFTTIAANIDETPQPGEAPDGLALRLAVAKAAAAASLCPAEEAALILASDTVVAQGDHILGKPDDAQHAAEMLRQLRGAPHVVHTAVCVLNHPAGERHTRLNSTAVVMRAYSDDEVRAYAATGDPLDKAGGYAVQHPEFAPVARLDGCYAGVMGLPLGDVRDLLAEQGIAPPNDIAAVCTRHAGRFTCCQQSIDRLRAS